MHIEITVQYPHNQMTLMIHTDKIPFRQDLGKDVEKVTFPDQGVSMVNPAPHDSAELLLGYNWDGDIDATIHTGSRFVYLHVKLDGSDKLVTHKPKVCECGAEAVKSPYHSEWCPKS